MTDRYFQHLDSGVPWAEVFFFGRQNYVGVVVKTRFEGAYERILAVTNCKTQVELAEVLGIRQASVSEAKRRGTVPAEWLVTLLQRYGLNPEWVLTGQGAQFLEPTKIHSEVLEASQLNCVAKPDFEAVAPKIQRVLQQSGFRGKGLVKCIAENRSFLHGMEEDVAFAKKYPWIKKYSQEIADFLSKLYENSQVQALSSYVPSVLETCGKGGENICRIQDMNRAVFIFSYYMQSAPICLKFALSGMEDCEIFFEDLKYVLREVSSATYKDNVYPWVGCDCTDFLLFTSS